MGDDVLQRCIDCARDGKITTTDELRLETKWARTSELGQEILDILHRCVISNDTMRPTYFYQTLSIT